MLHRLSQAIAQDFLVQGHHTPEDVAAAQVAFWQLLRSPYFNGNHDHLAFVSRGPLAFSLEMERNGNTVVLDPLNDFYPGDWDEPGTKAFRVPAPVGTREPEVLTTGGGIPSSVREKAQTIVERICAKQPRFSKLIHPSTEDKSRRRLVQVELLDREALDACLADVLGPGHSPSLQAEGIRYHSPSWSDDASWRYLVAHNREEVAGVLGFYAREQSLVLSYVSVAPGFRKNGLSMRLYEQLLDVCSLEQRFLVRSSPSEFTKDNPGITQAYGRLLREAPVLHVTTGGYLQKAIQDGLDDVGMAHLFPLAKPVCDARTLLELKGFEIDRWEREAAQQLRSDWSVVGRQNKPKAVRP